MLLVIAATPQELAGAAGARTLVCGIGPREAYLATEDAVAEGGADGVLHVGIAGARSGSGIPLLATVVGTEAVDCDGDSEPIAPAAKLLAACLDEGVPALELRVVSNEVEEPDRALWRFDDALAELARVTALVIAEIERT